jgi:haloalkane dehalogenase
MKPLVILSLLAFLLTGACAGNRNAGTKQMYQQFLSTQSHMQLQETGPDGERLRMAYTDVGPRSAPTVLLVHGVPTSSWLYRDMIPVLVAHGYRVVAPDNIGFGSSSKPQAEGYYSHASQAERLLDLMQQLGIERWHQVLHDVGGPISWEMAAGQPHRIHSLTVLNTIAYEAGFSPPRAVDSPVVRFSMRMIGFDNRPVIRNVICSMVQEPEELDTPRKLEGYYRPLMNGADYAYRDFLLNLDDTRAAFPRYREILSSLEKPVQVIWGAHDDVLIGATTIPLLQSDLRIPPSQIHVLDSAKHLLQEEEPELIADYIAEFLRQEAE